MGHRPADRGGLLFCTALLVCVIISQIYIGQIGDKELELKEDVSIDEADYYTVVINAFRRDDRLLDSIEHYRECSRARWIYVIWNDVTRIIPEPILMNSTIIKQSDMMNMTAHQLVRKRPSRVVFFIDESNLMTNRFKPRPFATQGVFQVDDDMIYDCSTVGRAHDAWRKIALLPEEQSGPAKFGVGFAARRIHLDQYLSMNEYRDKGLLHEGDDPDMGQQHIRYYNASASFASGYHNTIFVTKGAFLPRWVYSAYFNKKYAAMRAIADQYTTGEDIVMSAICWQEGIRLIPLHYQNMVPKIWNYLFSNEEHSQKKHALSRRTLHYRPKVTSVAIETLLKLNSWNSINDIPDSFAYPSDLWLIRWWTEYVETRLGGSWKYLERLYLFDLRMYGLY